eukprot:scaffold73300_cov51-Phaeocystis_antarctica.AAC.1
MGGHLGLRLFWLWLELGSGELPAAAVALVAAGLALATAALAQPAAAALATATAALAQPAAVVALAAEHLHERGLAADGGRSVQR